VTTSARGALSTTVPPVLLVVDDEPMLAQLFGAMLRFDGYDVLEAASSEQAFAVYNSLDRPVDLLVTDYCMPDGSGRALADELRARQGSLRVLFLTGCSGELFGESNMLQADEAFLEKPTSAAGLREAVALRLFGTLKPPFAVPVGHL
jgi:two-component system cell cycle sensor histidine kinase/response regulator CckA